MESHTTILDCQDDRALGRVAVLVIAEQTGRAFVAPRRRNLIANRRFIGSARPTHRRRHQPERVIPHRAKPSGVIPNIERYALTNSRPVSSCVSGAKRLLK